MKIENVKAVVFSPTGGTLKVTQALAQGVGLPYEIIDMTTPRTRIKAQTVFGSDLAIVASPVYYGHLTALAADIFKKLIGHNTPTVITCVYGNRHYDEALLEMQNLLESQGFIVIAASAHVAEHSYSDERHDIAAGRPHAADIEQAKEFGRQIRTAIDKSDFVAKRGLAVPFNPNPGYGFPEHPEPYIPKTLPGASDQWPHCIRICPAAAMAIRNDELHTDKSKCILCMACVKSFPNARFFDHPLIAMAKDNLAKLPPRENELWL